MDFREVASALQGARLDAHSLSLDQNAVALSVTGGAASHSVVFSAVTGYKWTPASPASDITLSVVGLERLGETEPWRLYIRTDGGTEVELSCGSVRCDGVAVTGIGRAYRH